MKKLLILVALIILSNEYKVKKKKKVKLINWKDFENGLGFGCGAQMLAFDKLSVEQMEEVMEYYGI